MIKTLVELLDHEDSRVVAIACYDLGEFARFFSEGRNYLDHLHVKEKIIEVMGREGTTADVKKEAITAYQKLLMTSWSGNAFK